MKYLPLILLLLSSSVLLGQISNFKEYQTAINEAELLLIENKKLAALDIYAKTLKSSKGNFSKDVYNALVLCKELSKTDMFFELLDYWLPKDLENDYINSIDVFKSFHSDKRWEQFLEKNQGYVIPRKKLRMAIDSLHEIDQFFRKMEGSYNVYGDTIKKIDAMNMQYLYDLIAKNQFPGEDETGVRDIYGQQGFDIVLHHYCQSTSQNDKLQKITPLLINLVLEGKILPNKCSHWLEMQNGEFTAGVFDIAGFSISGEKTGFFRPAYFPEQVLKINGYRKLLCMETLDEYYKKFAFTLNNPTSSYWFDVRKSIFEVPEQVFKDWSNGMIEIK